MGWRPIYDQHVAAGGSAASLRNTIFGQRRPSTFCLEGVGAVQFRITSSVFNYCFAPRQQAEHGMVVAQREDDWL